MKLNNTQFDITSANMKEGVLTLINQSIETIRPFGKYQTPTDSLQLKAREELDKLAQFSEEHLGWRVHCLEMVNFEELVKTPRFRVVQPILYRYFEGEDIKGNQVRLPERFQFGGTKQRMLYVLEDERPVSTILKVGTGNLDEFVQRLLNLIDIIPTAVALRNLTWENASKALERLDTNCVIVHHKEDRGFAPNRNEIGWKL